MAEVCKRQGCDITVWARGLCRRCYAQNWWGANLDKSRAKSRKSARKQRRANPEKFRLRTNLWHANHREYDAVANHYNIIVRDPKPAYKNLPFFSEWNPKVGGSIKVGEQWILSHLGRRPSSNFDLHIVDRRLGFVPDNLQWMPRSRHAQNEMIATLLLQVQQLQKSNKALRKKLR